MIVVLVTWIYYYWLLIGVGLLGYILIQRIFKRRYHLELGYVFIVGIVMTTVYAQIYSIFGALGAVSHIILLVSCISGYYCTLVIRSTEEACTPKEYMNKCVVAWHRLINSDAGFNWNLLLYIGIIIVVAYYTSRGRIHTDTNIYHANAIRWLEEYGVVPGLGNLQLHYAYNSSYFPFVAILSMKFLFGTSLHTTTGLIATYACIASIRYLMKWRERKRHLSDFISVALLIYVIVNITGCVSPASDYMSNYMGIIALFCWSKLSDKGEDDYMGYALVALLSIYLITLKVSMLTIVLLAIYPFILLIKSKRYKEVAYCIVISLIIIIPFIIRNIIISGWLIYPISVMDLFDVDWKIPIDRLEHDSAQIIVWGRKLYDVKLIDVSIVEWCPVWWSQSERYERMLILSNVFSMLLILSNICREVYIGAHNKKTHKSEVGCGIRSECAYYFIIITTLVGLLMWFLSAPFVRYGLTFLLVLPAIALGRSLSYEEIMRGPYRLLRVLLISFIILCFAPYIDHYITDDIVFVKQQLVEEYYIIPKEYEVAELGEIEVDGNVFYYPLHGADRGDDQIGYGPIPSSAYLSMIESMEMRSGDIRDGFRAKDN